MKREKTHYDLLNGSASAGVSFSCVILLYLILNTIAGAILNASKVDENSLLYMAISLLCPIIATAVVISVLSLKRKQKILLTVNFSKFNPLYLVPAVLLAIGMLLGLGFMNELIAQTVVKWGGNVVDNSDKIKGAMTGFGEFLLLAFLLTILPAIFEESLFRGVILEGIKSMSSLLTIFTVSLCFALYHCNVAKLVYQLIYGVGLTVLAMQSKSIVPSIITHFLNNFVILLLTYTGINIDLNAWYVILIGIAILALFVLSMLCLYKQGEKIKKEQREERRMPESQPYKKFWVPFGAYACGILVMIIIAGVIS